jgi:Domain of unknown function (DUF4337)
MTHGHNPAEEAEHTSHAAHNPFDKRVALSMVVIAAVLAAVKVAGHRSHSETLRLQIQANVKHSQANDKHTQANVAHTQESDLWNFYQAQKIRQHLYESQADMLEITGKEGKYGADSMAKIDGWRTRITKYKHETDSIKKDAEEKKKQGEAYNEEADKITKEAETLERKSEHEHHRSNYYDLGEMAVEIGLVLCSLAILVRIAMFWYSGMVVALLGAGIAGIGLLPDKHEEHDSKGHAALVQPAVPFTPASGPGGAGGPG